MLTCPVLYGSGFALTSEGALTALTSLAVHMCYEYEFLSNEIVAIILNGLRKADATSAKPFFELMSGTVAIADALQQHRYDRLLAQPGGVLDLLYSARLGDARLVYVCIKFLMRVMRETPAFGARMMACRESTWIWIDRWLRDYVERKVSASAPAPSASVQAARMQTFEAYSEMIGEMGGTINLEPPPMLLIGDSSGNARSGPMAAGCGDSTAVILHPEHAGREAMDVPMVNPNGESSSTPAGEIIALGVKINQNYIPRSGAAPGGGDSDDEFNEGGEKPLPHLQGASRQRAALAITLSHPSVSEEVERMGAEGGGRLAGPAAGGSGPGLVDGAAAGGGSGGSGGEDDAVESDEKSSSYKQRPPSYSAVPSEVACSVCTYLNPPGRLTCDMCSTALTKPNDID
jgi:hypothetical protein